MKALLPGGSEEKLYLCIRDLLEHGLDLSRFGPGDLKPNRQDITQYLAAWSRHAGLSEEESKRWMMEYTTTILGVLSKRTPAAIRHSTKGNLRYIYGSEVAFACSCASNSFRAHCSEACPLHAEMQARLVAKAAEDPRPWLQPRPPAPVYPTVLPVKVANREQFETAMKLVREELEKGTKKTGILALLEERGLKTRTGKKWTYSGLVAEIVKSNLHGITALRKAGQPPSPPISSE